MNENPKVTASEQLPDQQATTDRSFWVDLIIAGFLVALCVALRLFLVQWPNLSPVAGFALLGGLTLRHRSLALGIPLVSMLITDQVLGGYDWIVMAAVYGCLTAPVVIGWIGRSRLPRQGWSRHIAATGFGLAAGLVASLCFFFVTNLAFWYCFEMGRTSLAQCYIDALPFFRYTLLGDLIFCGSLTTGWSFANRFAVAMQQRKSIVATQDADLTSV